MVLALREPVQVPRLVRLREAGRGVIDDLGVSAAARAQADDDFAAAAAALHSVRSARAGSAPGGGACGPGRRTPRGTWSSVRGGLTLGFGFGCGLGVRLGGRNTYDGVADVRPHLGDQLRPLEAPCIPQAVRDYCARSGQNLLSGWDKRRSEWRTPVYKPMRVSAR